AICEKAAHFGNAVSHSHRRSNKMWKANVKSVKVKTNGGAHKGGTKMEQAVGTRIAALRKRMAERGMDAYLIPTAD
ncbi:bL28 family ribosomal protein, partial [[Clostridium] symbiosum]|uniref:large ribosomal subunit protein bL28 n=1 Tax=Clostridium symbiosum TaxID=1512 RepID=UPI00210A4025